MPVRISLGVERGDRGAGPAHRLLAFHRQHDHKHRRPAATFQNVPDEIDFGLTHLAPQRPAPRRVREFLHLHTELDARRLAEFVSHTDAYPLTALAQYAMRAP